ncbi:vesicle-associated membrane protein 8 [Ostrea edulis]|uniref:Vesicle-associated membrane protein n=1 Tax=Ostrea edulis TaxID=37623 RepID=K9LHI8_OSTED|nr:vesicle-associated membrane protein 8 [Ostrea edulis]AFJ91811.1 vesicle-associated membrane protein [Ostrea edulis]
MVDNPTIQDLNEQVDDLKGVMKDNIGKVIDRGDKLETLQTRAEDLEQNANMFQKTTTNIKRKQQWRNRKTMIILVVVVTVLVTAIVLIALGTNGVFSS